MIDASAAVRIAMQPAETPSFTAQLAEADWSVAPELLVAEVASAYWKYVRAGTLDPIEGARLLESSVALADEFVPLRELVSEAFDLALSRRRGAVLLTADEAMQKTARELGVRVVGPR